ncbi:MAG: ion transporter [Pseudomonadota bacterium]
MSLSTPPLDASTARRALSPAARVRDRRWLRVILESQPFTYVITALILLNAVTLGLETNAALKENFGTLLSVVDTTVLIVFTAEIIAKLYVYRRSFFSSGWNWFDLIIVAIAWAPASDGLAILRAFRILRVLRLLSVVPQMRRVIGAIGHAIPGMVSVIGVLGLVFYIAAVLATKLFGTHPDPRMQEWFGSVWASAYTLFQVMTLESWSMGIVRPTMELFPLAWAFFVPFIVVTSFAVLNLFIGIIVDAMQTAHAADDLAAMDDADRPATRADIARLEEKLVALTREPASAQAKVAARSSGD